MDNPNYTTEHRKGQHLLNEERYEIEVRLKDGWSIYKIAKHLGRAYNTIKDEVERGTVTLYNGMNDKSFTAVLGIIVPEIVHRISENYSCDEVAATEEFYASKVYALLEQEETKLWHFSPLTLFNMYDEERNTGSFSFPEEG